MQLKKLLPRIVANLVPALGVDILQHPSLDASTYQKIATDAVNALVKAFNDEWVAEHPNDKPPINTSLTAVNPTVKPVVKP